MFEFIIDPELEGVSYIRHNANKMWESWNTKDKCSTNNLQSRIQILKIYCVNILDLDSDLHEKK